MILWFNMYRSKGMLDRPEGNHALWFVWIKHRAPLPSEEALHNVRLANGWPVIAVVQEGGEMPSRI
eukprot:11548416-Prorocentrum_lima.AAC.1